MNPTVRASEKLKTDKAQAGERQRPSAHAELCGFQLQIKCVGGDIIALLRSENVCGSLGSVIFTSWTAKDLGRVAL